MSIRTASVGSEGRKEDQEGLVKVIPGEYLHHGRCQQQHSNTPQHKTSTKQQSSTNITLTTTHSAHCSLLCCAAATVFRCVDKVLGIAGQGTFGTVLDVYDTKHRQRLALKVVRSVKRYLEAAAIEIEILEKLRQADPRKESSAAHSTTASAHLSLMSPLRLLTTSPPLHAAVCQSVCPAVPRLRVASRWSEARVYRYGEAGSFVVRVLEEE